MKVLDHQTGRMSRKLASDQFVTVLDSLEVQKALKMRNRMVLEVCAEVGPCVCLIVIYRISVCCFSLCISLHLL